MLFLTSPPHSPVPGQKTTAQSGRPGPQPARPGTRHPWRLSVRDNVATCWQGSKFGGRAGMGPGPEPSRSHSLQFHWEHPHLPRATGTEQPATEGFAEEGRAAGVTAGWCHLSGPGARVDARAPEARKCSATRPPQVTLEAAQLPDLRPPRRRPAAACSHEKEPACCRGPPPPGSRRMWSPQQRGQ